MILLSVQNVSKSFGVNRVLKSASLTLQDGRRLGLVGVNGSGKSTLLNIIAGEETPDGGQITMARGLSIGYLAQQGAVTAGRSVWAELEAVFAPVQAMEARLRAMEAEMAEKHADEEAFARLARQYADLTDAFEAAEGYAWRSAVQGVLAGLGFQRAQWDQPADLLSGGERTRLCLARLLLQKPDLLLLDEPTNHLDLAALAWLEQYMQGYKGAILVVSHDRYLLDAVCTDIVELIFGETEQYTGNYTRYLAQRTERFETRRRAYDAQQKEMQRQREIIRQLRSFCEEKFIKRAQSREKSLDKMEPLQKPTDEKQVRFAFEARRRSGDDVLIAKDLAKAYGGRTLFAELSLHLRTGDRVALIGPNGVGKSTLLKIIAGVLAPDAGTVRYGSNVDKGYYDQHQQDLHPEKTVLNELWDRFPQMEPGDLRGILGCFLFSGDDVFQPVATLSGGERGRLALAGLMLQKNNFLLLDEPTNHLDMDSREVLEQALEDFPGTLLTVSHDRYFINRLVTRVIEMREDGVTVYLGNYDDYQEKKRRMAQGDAEPQPGKTRTEIEREKRKERRAREAAKAERARIAAIESAILSAEEEIAALETALAEPAVYANPARAKETAAALKTAREALEKLYAQWEETEAW